MKMDRWKMAWEIYGALRLAGADIGDASVPIIGEVLGEYITDDGNLREAAPMLLKALTEGIGIHPTDDFATDLETIAHFIKMYHPLAADDLRRKSKAIRAAIAAAKGGEK